MATDSIVGGLFGMTPEQYDIGLRQQEQATGAQLAQLTPFQRGQAAIYSGGAQLGRGLGGLMGAVDPQMQLQSLRASVMQGVDPNDSASIAKAAQALARANDQQGAMQLAQLALNRRDIESQISGRTEEKQAQREMQMQLAREKMQSMEQIAKDRNEIMVQIAQMNAALKGSTNDLQRQLLEQKIEDLKLKADEKQATLQSQAQGRVAAFDSAIETLDVLSKHPGKKDVVGALTGGVMSIIPGTNAAGFASQLETFKAQTFIPQVAALKGMGALSDAEGKKLTAAVGALDPKMKPKEFDNQITKIKGDLETAKQRALKMPGMPKQTEAPAVGTVSNPIVLK